MKKAMEKAIMLAARNRGIDGARQYIFDKPCAKICPVFDEYALAVIGGEKFIKKMIDKGYHFKIYPFD